jgi:prepilin-type N-terminal cleavage/methylation domain-containing protein
MFWPFSALRKNTYSQLMVKRSGFGLVELMVSISIMVVLMSVIFARHGSFNSAVLLRSETYKIALQAREVQLEAVSVEGDGAGNFRSVLGLHFTSDSSPAGDPLNGYYNIFRDGDDDFYYDSGEEYGLQGVLDSRFEVREIREAGTLNPYSDLSVVFERPNFDAKFYSASGVEAVVSGVEIDIARRGESHVRTLEITKTGQIAVQ